MLKRVLLVLSIVALSGNGFVSMPVPLPDGRLLLHSFWGLYCVNAAQ